MPSIVKVPKDNEADYDFIAFSFDGLHSIEDFGIYRVSDGDKYNENLAPTMNDRTADNPARDGQYYFGTSHKQRVFDINFAFDSLTESKLSQLKKWLNGKKVADLWFAEAPHKVYSAKVTGTPSIKALCFDESYDDNGTKKVRRVYKGEGNVQFTCYYPYAHTPDFVDITNTLTAAQQADSKVQKQFSGELYANYSSFSNYDQIKTLLPGNKELPFGEAPFHFVAHLVGPGEVSATSLSVTNLKEETETLNTTNGITTYLKVEKTGSTLTAIPGYTRTENTTLIIGG